MKVYVDMDGVIADFDTGFKKIFGTSPKGLTQAQEDEFKNRMKSERFYEKLPTFPGAKSFILTLQKVFGEDNVEILTAVSSINSVDNAKQKQKWLKKHIGGNIKFNWVEKSRFKAKYATKDALLIDDRTESCDPFRAAGGQAILHTKFTKSLKEANRLNMSEGKYSFLEYNTLNEVAIQFNGKNYPKFNNVVILAGGAGSGKGFTASKLINIEGKTFDVDAIKTLAMNTRIFSGKVKDETGYDITKFDMRKPENVKVAHELLSDVYNITGKRQRAAFTSIATSAPDRKPNLIFDVTLKDMAKVDKISSMVQNLGYDKRNIHIVWVVNKFDAAVSQNSARDRVVPDEIMLSTHEGASLTMKKLLSMGSKLQKYINGEIYLAFNQIKVDSDLEFSDYGGSYIKAADYIKVKDTGSAIIKNLDDKVIQKIKSYVPNTETW